MILVTTPGNVRTPSHSPAGSCWPATRATSPGCGPVAEIALIDAGELRVDTSERGLLTDTAAIPTRPRSGERFVTNAIPRSVSMAFPSAAQCGHGGGVTPSGVEQ